MSLRKMWEGAVVGSPGPLATQGWGGLTRPLPFTTPLLPTVQSSLENPVLRTLNDHCLPRHKGGKAAVTSAA